MRVESLSLTAIRPSPHNPRLIRDKDPDLASLAESIAALGVLQPVLVRPVHGVNGDGVTHELIAGERRFRAAKLAKLAEIPALVREDLDDHQALELTVTENLQREDLHPLEEAKGVASLLGDGHDYRTVADRLGKSLGWVARRARLATLSAKWKKLAENPNSQVSDWPAAMLEQVARLELSAQDAFLTENEDLAHRLREWEDPLNTAGLRQILAEWTRELRLAPWKLDDETLEPKAGACTSCPKRSSCHPGLFDDEPETKKASPGDRCLDATCWDRKLEIHLARKADELEQKHGAVVFAGDTYGEKAPKIVSGRNAKMVNRWDGQRAKKGDQGAVPVLHVTGHDRGKVEWRVFDKSATPAARKAAAGGVKQTLSLAEKRKRHEARRRAHALEATCEAVLGAPVPPERVLILLAAAFGTEHTADRPGNDYHPRSNSGPKLIDRDMTFPTMEEAARHAQELWSSVAAVIVRRWRYALRTFGTTGLTKYSTEIERVASLLSIDLAPFAAAAAEAIPEPKSWAKQAAAEKAAKKAGKGKAAA